MTDGPAAAADDPVARALAAQGVTGRSLARRTTRVAAVATVCSNVIGGIIVFVLLAWVLPVPDEFASAHVVVANLLWTVAFALGTIPITAALGIRSARRRLGWLVQERTPTRSERRRTLRIPLLVTARQMSIWTLAAILFGIKDGLLSPLLGVEVGVTVLIGGLTNAAVTYLLVEATSRRLLPLLFVGVPLRRRPGAGVAWRTVMVWGLGTGLPVAGISLLAGLSLGIDIRRQELALAVLVLALVSIGSGLLAIVLHSRTITAPLTTLRASLVRVEQGDLDLTVPVTTTTEIGVLQAAVNGMVEGLRERRHLRELFGLHVGEDVVRRALDDGVALGGEVRDVAALFVDVADSTGLAQRVPPEQFLGLLNDLFGVVVEVVDGQGGLVNKFVGDAALAVWGAPLAHPDPSGAALSAAAELGRRLPREVPALTVGVGVAAGPVVAGNLGARQRLEYTVIGDPVNIASRLSSLAKSTPARVLAQATMVSDECGEQWVDVGEATVRGRTEPTPLVAPAGLAVTPGRS